jgi:hypothetical protein
MDAKNKLYFGDNLKILREYVPDASVDLIYLDPPFNSSATYNVLFKEKSGEESAAQITAFEDTWQWSQEAVYREIVERGPRKLADLMQALRGSPFGDTMRSVDRKHPQGRGVCDPRSPAVAVSCYADWDRALCGSASSEVGAQLATNLREELWQFR